MKHLISQCHLHNLKTLQMVYNEWQSGKSFIEWTIYPPFNLKLWKKQKSMSIFYALILLCVAIMPFLYGEQLSLIFRFILSIVLFVLAGGLIYLSPTISRFEYSYFMRTYLSIDREKKIARIVRSVGGGRTAERKIRYKNGERGDFQAFHLPENISPKNIEMRDTLQSLIRIETGITFKDEFFYLSWSEKITK